MRKFIQQKLKDQKGLTLIELLAVIVILAIIAAIAIPAIGNIIENSRVGAIKSDALNAIAASELYFTDNPGAASVTLTDLADDTNGKYIDDLGSLSSASTDVVTKEGEITTTGTIGGVIIGFNDAKKDDINALKNSTPAVASGSITVSR